MSAPGHPVAVEEIVDYLAGDLAAAGADALEDHLFECPRCASVLDSVDRLAAAVRDVVRHGALGGTVTGAFIAASGTPSGTPATSPAASSR